MIRIIVSTTSTLATKIPRKLSGITLYPCPPQLNYRYTKSQTQGISPTVSTTSSNTIQNTRATSLTTEHRKVVQPLLSSPSQSIETAIFLQQQLPSFREQLFSLPFLSPLTTYNPSLTTGGDNFEEFPLIKLLHIATKHAIQHNKDISEWKRLQKTIRNRMHRCSIDEHLRLLYVMLQVFNRYQFSFEFIMAVCIALKKQISIMNTQQINALFCILSINQHQTKKYSNSVLEKTQSTILGQLLSKIQKNDIHAKESGKTHLPIEHLYLWIALTLGLSLRSDYQTLKLDDRAVRVLMQLQKRWKELTHRQLKAKTPAKYHFLLAVEILAYLEPIISENPTAVERHSNKYNLLEEFRKSKRAILSHCSKIVTLLLNQPPNAQSLMAYRALSTLYPFAEILTTFLDKQEVTAQSNQQNRLLSQLIGLVNIQAQYGLTQQKVSLLNTLYNQNIIDEHITSSLYQSIDLTQHKQPTLDLVHQLLLIELYLYQARGIMKPRKEAQKIIFEYIEGLSRIHRHFDWLAFHFVRLILAQTTTYTSQMQISSTLPSQNNKNNQNEGQAKDIWKVLSHILEMSRIEKYAEIVAEETALLRMNPAIKEVSKFFIEIRVHEMKMAQSVVAPFDRLVHFGNSSQKIAVNAYSEKQLKMKRVELQRVLLMSMGWRVINLNSEAFQELSINERLEMLTFQFQSQKALIDERKRYLKQMKLLDQDIYA